MFSDELVDIVSADVWECGYYNEPEKIGLDEAEEVVEEFFREWSPKDLPADLNAENYMTLWNESVDIWKERNKREV